MTKNDINKYNNGKIYTIRCRTDNDLIYVGSSTQPLHKRFYEHKMKLMNGGYNHRLLYNKMDELGIDNFYIELYEHYNCNSKEELNRREGEIIRQIGNLNKNIAGQTIQEYSKKWREDNKDIIKEKKQLYQQTNKEKIKDYQKEYRQNNKDKLSEKQKQYIDENKETIKEKRSKPCLCECGCTVQKSELPRHIKTTKHINLMSQKEEQK